MNSRVPKLGPPLYVRPLHRSPCNTPALANSSARYKGSWNLSFTLEALIPAESALPSVVCVWFGFCKLRRLTHIDGLQSEASIRLSASDSYPLRSKNLQITFATISSLLSNGLPALEVALVLLADSSELVAPRHNLKSIVEDYAGHLVGQAVLPQEWSGPGTHVLLSQLVFHRTIRHMPARTSVGQAFSLGRIEVDNMPLHVDVRRIKEVVCSLKHHHEYQFRCVTIVTNSRLTILFCCHAWFRHEVRSAKAVHLGAVAPSVITFSIYFLYSMLSPLSSGGSSWMIPLVSHPTN